MLRKVTEMYAEDLEILLIFVNLSTNADLIENINELIDIKHFKYEDVLEIATANKDKNVRINVEDIFDKVMFEAYDIYFNLKDTLNDAHKEYSNIKEMDMMWKFIPLYEKLLSTSKFSHADTRTIQKMFFQNLLKEEIKRENYEKCTEIQNKIKIV